MFQMMSRFSDMPSGPWRTNNASSQQSIANKSTFHPRKPSTSKPKVSFKVHVRNNQASTRRKAAKTKPQRESAGSAKRFTSLFISLLAVTPMAIECGAVGQETVDAMQRAPVRQKGQGKRAVSGAEIRKMRWKRFKYEMGLKVKSQCTAKGRGRRRWEDEGDVELQELLVRRPK